MRRTVGLAAILAVCGGAMVACAVDQAPLAPQPDVRLSQHSGGAMTPVPFLVCNDNQSYGGSALIGPLGGRLVFGPHVLTVPAGALLIPTTITAQTLTRDTIAVQLQPESLAFALPATLQLSYMQCVPQPTEPVAIIAVNDQLNAQLGFVQPVPAFGQGAVAGAIAQLGAYAVATR